MIVTVNVLMFCSVHIVVRFFKMLKTDCYYTVESFTVDSLARVSQLRLYGGEFYSGEFFSR